VKELDNMHDEQHNDGASEDEDVEGMDVDDAGNDDDSWDGGNGYNQF